jgi:hypothetical protein
MDGKLWNQVYRIVRQVARSFSVARGGRGRPDRYGIDTIWLCWLWSAWRIQSLLEAHQELSTRRLRRRWKRGGFRLPCRIPHATTLHRRAKRADFEQFGRVLQQTLRKRLAPQQARAVLDSTPLPVGRMSNDPDAALGVYRLFGYRWHTIISVDGVLLASEVMAANVHDTRVASRLVEQLEKPLRYLVADGAYDSEELHRIVHQQLHGRLIAPLNRRGNLEHRFRGTPLRKWLAERWNTPLVSRLRRLRGTIERFYSRLKSSRFGLWALPPWVRRLPSVRRWILLKAVLYHVTLYLQRKHHSA